MKTVCFGEIMLRLNPANYERFVQADSFGATYGGGEANVAISLSNFGIDSSYVTKLPDHDIGQSAINAMRRYGVDSSKIVRGGDRIGIYFLETGASQRPSKVIYDRKGSAISLAKRSDFDWDKILDGADWFNFTGITPALGGELPDICLDALKVCRKKGITTSCDVNFRKNLWSSEEAGKVMGELLKYVDVCISNEEHAEKLFGITPKKTYPADDSVDYEICEDVAKQLSLKFGCKKVIITVRRTISADDNTLSALIYDKDENRCCVSRSYKMHIIDRIGGGDALCAGAIYCFLTSKSLQESIDFAVASSVLKHSIQGDFNVSSVKEIEELVKNGSGRVQR